MWFYLSISPLFPIFSVILVLRNGKLCQCGSQSHFCCDSSLRNYNYSIPYSNVGGCLSGGGFLTSPLHWFLSIRFVRPVPPSCMNLWWCLRIWCLRKTWKMFWTSSVKLSGEWSFLTLLHSRDGISARWSGLRIFCDSSFSCGWAI